MNILVVDDDSYVTELLADLLQDLGYQVECVVNGAEALARMGAKTFDLMLTDINMPVMGGMELIERVKKLDNPPIVVVITAYASMQSAIDALKAGVYDYIVKPFKLNIVINAVERALEKQFLQRENVNLKEMMALYRASDSISSQSSLDELVKVLFESVASFTKADFMALYLDDASNGEKGDFRLSRRQLFQKMTASERYLINSLPKKLLYNEVEDCFFGNGSKIFKDNDPSLALFFRKSAKPIHFSSMMVFSLKSLNRPVGVMVLVSFTPEVIFPDRLRRYLYMLISKAAACIENRFLNENLQRQYIETVESFIQALEVKDPYTHGHSRQVSHYAVLIARQLEGFSKENFAILQQAAVLHDIGKIGISDAILDFPGELSEGEFDEIRKHPGKGRNILGPVSSLAAVVEVVYHHHEHWDGNGYPDGLIGLEIPLMARIIGIADAFDAMTSHRPY
ncbi:MAG: response regulator, partial [Pseudomonadota bacterium]|nr:response regulator [Pseudomonadota bacterium]